MPIWKKKLKEHLEAFGKSILIKKEKKYWSDKNAFRHGRAYNWNQDKKIYKKNHDYSSNTPSNSSSSASSHTGRLFGKIKGPFPKQHEMEGEIQQKNKKRTTDSPQTESSRGGRGGGYNTVRGAQNENTRD